jgi:uncharacterized tellurite resistance protein B-like protein
LKKLFTELTGGAKPQERFEDNDYRLAAAALLIHAAMVDGSISDVERDKLRHVLGERFDLDDAATTELVDAAIAAEREAIDLYGFTSLISRSLDEEGRRRIVEMLWQVVYADGRVHEFEDNLVWRVADLLGVSSRERIESRRSVAGRRSRSDRDD